MLVGGQKPVPEATGNSPDEKMDTESTNGVELCRVFLESGTYREIILLCFSDVVATDTVLFKEHLEGSTDYLLSKAQFPFDAVVFASLGQGNPVRVYRKGNPRLTPPAPSNHSGVTETVVHGPTMRIGQTYNLREVMSNEPLITRRQPKPAP